MMNNRKICFITCVTDDELYTESLLYIKSLHVPAGFKVEAKPIKQALSMAKGCNQGLKGTDAKYKVYLHQDVFITNKFFIRNMLAVFKDNPSIGMLGVVGAKNMPASGVWWKAKNKYGKVYDSHTGRMELLNFTEFSGAYQEVDCIDGLLMATQYDVPWREDIFDGWHFYDMSQSMEFIRAKFKVAVLRQEEAWCIHDSGIASIIGYEKYREKFVKEYQNELFKDELAAKTLQECKGACP